MESKVFLLSLSVKLMTSHLRRSHDHDICVTENCVLLGYYAGSSGNSLPTSRDNSSGNSLPTVWFDRLSQKVGKELPLLSS